MLINNLFQSVFSREGLKSGLRTALLDSLQSYGKFEYLLHFKGFTGLFRMTEKGIFVFQILFFVISRAAVSEVRPCIKFLLNGIRPISRNSSREVQNLQKKILTFSRIFREIVIFLPYIIQYF